MNNILEHINSIDSGIKFTVEDTRCNGSMPFPDTLVIIEHNGILSIRVHRKPTHTDQYLQWDNHHHLGVKYSIINTLNHRAKTLSSTTEHLRSQVEHISHECTLNTTIPTKAS